MSDGPTSGRPTRPRPADRRCAACGSGDLEEGYLDESGAETRGFVRWVTGPLVRGRFGGTKGADNPRWIVDALRCPVCSHVSLYATRRA